MYARDLGSPTSRGLQATAEATLGGMLPLSIPLEPVDSLTVTTLVDNVFDTFMPDQGPAHRISPVSGPRRTLPSATMIDGLVPDQLIAEHGLSLMLTVVKGDRIHRLLFDTGVSTD